MSATSSENIMFPLVLQLALIASGAALFTMFTAMMPAPPPLDPTLPTLPSGDQQLASIMLICAVIVGIGGRAFGQVLLRKNNDKLASLAEYVGRVMMSTIVSFSTREAAIIMAAISVRFGGRMVTGASVAGVILVSMLFDLRTPGRLRKEWEAVKALRSAL